MQVRGGLPATADGAFERGGVRAIDVVATGAQAGSDGEGGAGEGRGAGEGGALFGEGEQGLHAQPELAQGLAGDGGFEVGALAAAVADDEGEQAGGRPGRDDGVPVEHELRGNGDALLSVPQSWIQDEAVMVVATDYILEENSLLELVQAKEKYQADIVMSLKECPLEELAAVDPISPNRMCWFLTSIRPKKDGGIKPRL